MTVTRKRRGRETELWTAAYWQTRGFPYCEPVGSGAPGRDLTGTGPVAVEIKARAAFNPLAWIKQVRKNAQPTDVPCVIFRCNGQGVTAIDDWPVMTNHATWMRLLREAGYAS